MIRFRNPGSDLDTMIAVLKQLYHELHEKDFFDNTDIAKVLSKANLMASSGLKPTIMRKCMRKFSEY